MKKRFLACILALALCVGMCPAFAAVESGGTEYLWYVDWPGTLYISADNGASYAELPGLGEAQARNGLNYCYTTNVVPLPGGGLEVMARDVWSPEITFQRQYSREELSSALSGAVQTPVRVLATNGTVTVGSRGRKDMVRDFSGESQWMDEIDQLVYSTDGVTWNPGKCPEDGFSVDSDGGRWDGTAFYVNSGGLTSVDGIHWSETGETRINPKLHYAADLGPYHFELVRKEGGNSGFFDVYLMDQTAGDTGVLLPHMGNAIQAEGLGAGEIQAWYGPDETVFLAVYDQYQKEKSKVCINYPIASLDWCLENLSVSFRQVEAQATNGAVSLGAVDQYFYFPIQQAQVLRNDGTGWKRLMDVPWGPDARVLPYNGKTFLVADGTGHHLYASDDGLSWTLTDVLRPAEIGGEGIWDYINYAFTWSGKAYIACREAAVQRHGMMGNNGGWWYEGNTSVYFLDEKFQLIRSHDFGRKVEVVGYYGGAYYVQVANSTGNRYGFSGEDVFDETLGSTLYRSADGKTWTAVDAGEADVPLITLQ